MGAAGSEHDRIHFLLRRDGPEAAREWVERTAAIYREALASPQNHASLKEYRPLFERAVEDFETWLSEQDQSLSSSPSRELPP